MDDQAENIDLDELDRIRIRDNTEQWLDQLHKRHRKDSRWLEALTAKAERYVLRPIEANYSADPKVYDFAELGAFATKLKPCLDSDEPSFLTDLNELGGLLCFSDVVPIDVYDKLFPSWDTIRLTTDNPNHCRQAFLYFIQSQIAWRAVREGWAICVAEDAIALGGGLYSWVEPNKISELSDIGTLLLPEELNVKSWTDLSDRIEQEVGADRLWFILTKDLQHHFETTKNKRKLGGPKNRADILEEKKAAQWMRSVYAEFSSTDKEISKKQAYYVVDECFDDISYNAFDENIWTKDNCPDWAKQYKGRIAKLKKVNTSEVTKHCKDYFLSNQ